MKRFVLQVLLTASLAVPALARAGNDPAMASEAVPALPYHTLFGVGYGQGLYVAVGNDYGSNTCLVMTSPDGQTWTERNSSVAGVLNAITYGNGLYVAVGLSYASAS